MIPDLPVPPPNFTELHLFLCVCAGVMGLIWGSFFNVCIFRIPAKKSIVHPGSHCGTCGTPLKPWQNVPVLGWFFLRGRCGHCGQPYGIRYPMVELLTGLLFLGAYLQAGPTGLLLTHILFIGLLMVGIYTDIDHFILPDRVTLGGTAAMVVLSPLVGGASFAAQDLGFLVDQVAFWTNAPSSVALERLPGWAQGLCGSVVGAIVGYGMLTAVAVFGRLVFRKEAMGQGDVKLFALIGACLGAVNAVAILFAASVLGLVVSVFGIAVHSLFGKDQMDRVEIRAWDRAPEDEPVAINIDRRTARSLRELPFGPYIAVAGIAAMLFQADVRQLIHTPIDAYAPPPGGRSKQEVLPGISVPALRLVGDPSRK